LGVLRASRPSDAWHIGDHLGGQRWTLSYRSGAPEIAVLLVRAPASPWQRRERLAPRVTVEQWTGLFGASLDDRRFRKAMSPLDVQGQAGTQDDVDEVAFIREAGIQLYFDTARCFRGVRFFAERELDARGYGGSLPRGLRFDDDPETLFRKLARKPAEQDEDRISGHALWRLPEATLHVLYSTVDNTLLRVMWTARRRAGARPARPGKRR
jgi:hypothetical protein